MNVAIIECLYMLAVSPCLFPCACDCVVCVCALFLWLTKIWTQKKTHTLRLHKEKDEYKIERTYHIFGLGYFPWHFRCFNPFFILSIYQIEKYVWISKVSAPHTPSTLIHIRYRKITNCFLVFKSGRILCYSILFVVVDIRTGCVGDIDFIESTRI